MLCLNFKLFLFNAIQFVYGCYFNVVLRIAFWLGFVFLSRNVYFGLLCPCLSAFPCFSAFLLLHFFDTAAPFPHGPPSPAHRTATISKTKQTRKKNFKTLRFIILNAFRNDFVLILLWLIMIELMISGSPHVIISGCARWLGYKLFQAATPYWISTATSCPRQKENKTLSLYMYIFICFSKFTTIFSYFCMPPVYLYLSIWRYMKI